MPAAGAPAAGMEVSLAGWNVELAVGENPEFARHVRHMAKPECTVALCSR